MVKKPVNLYISFVIGVIVLFIGVGIQPAFAVYPNTSDDEDDCELCTKVSNQHLIRLKNLISKLETLKNKLTIISKLNPIVIEKYQELSNKIENIQILRGDGPICKFLEKILDEFDSHIWPIIYKLNTIMIFFRDRGFLIIPFLICFITAIPMILLSPFEYFWLFLCWEVGPIL